MNKAMTKYELNLCWKALAAFLLMIAAMCLSILTSCSEEDGMFERGNTETLPTVICTDKILRADTEYLLGSPVFVTNGATLTIEPGTLLKALPASGKGKAALVITKGCKIIAEGSEDMPVVMTSMLKEPGNWGGLIILGKAPLSYRGESMHCGDIPVDISYGGTDGDDNSGILRYVRVEYAGAEGGAFTFNATGKGTVIDHCQSFHSGNDGFTFNGGTVNARYLISTKAEGNGLCFQEGYDGRLQYIKVAASTLRSQWSVISCNGAERDNDRLPYTNPVIANLSTGGKTRAHELRCPVAVTCYSCLTLINSDANDMATPDGIHVQFIGGQAEKVPGTEYLLINATERESKLTADKFTLDPFFEQTSYIGAVPPGTAKEKDWTMSIWIRNTKK